MPRPKIDVASLAIDGLGRVVIPDDLLDKIEACEHILSAGANSLCPGSTNGGCSNGGCGNSSNQECNNSIYCQGAQNHQYCQDGPIG
jgi:hypothetical protein